ncbi:MAG: class I SAM-dependent methyltransferase, partial [Verrucomicrobiaceae bacterium]
MRIDRAGRRCRRHGELVTKSTHFCKDADGGCWERRSSDRHLSRWPIRPAVPRVLQKRPFPSNLRAVIQRRPFRYPGTDEDVVRLEALLRDGLRAAGFHATGPLDVMNLACGRADESGALGKALEPMKIGFYLGIDLRPDAIAEAAARWALPSGEIEFRCGDASATDRMRQLPAFDFIFIRHQNYWHEPAVWDRLLGNALGRLKPSGLLACTSYFDREHELLVAALRTRGAALAANLRHARSRPLPDAPG